MSILRQTRLIYWISRDLMVKYTRLLVLGFLGGFTVAIIFWQGFSTFAKHYLMPIDRIGVVGEVSPSSLPLSIQQKISGGLTELTPDGNVKSGLASWWEASSSGQQYIFHLRDDIEWQNGKKVQANDVNYNIRDTKITVLDPLTLKINIKSPYSPFPVLLSKPLFKTGLIGFGKYKVESIHLSGDDLQMIRLAPVNENDTHRIEEYRFYQTETMAILAYKLGNIDKIEDISSPGDLTHWGQTKISSNNRNNRIVAVFFNLKNTLLSEKNFRQALGYALPQFDEERAISPIPNTSWAYTDNVRKYDPDDTQVKKLLTASKVGTEEAQLVISAFPQYLDTAQKIADSWKSHGINSTIKVENAIPNDYQILISAIDVPPDPDQYALWHSTQAGTNVTGYANVKIDKLLEDGRQEMDIDKRKKIYADFARRLVDDAPALFLYYPKYYAISRK
jgi:peptide/nickel transport system substrate-binding protein